jgi:hypothetical protein
MDFRMEKSSWAMLAFILATYMYFILAGAGTGLSFMAYLQMFFYALITLVAIVALSCIPVIIYCYIVKKIPDIDYSVILAFAATIIGILSELF